MNEQESRAGCAESEPTALEQYQDCLGDQEPDPLERLRFFCSCAMKGQDWLDSEPFFDAVRAKLSTIEASKR